MNVATLLLPFFLVSSLGLAGETSRWIPTVIDRYRADEGMQSLPAAITVDDNAWIVSGGRFRESEFGNFTGLIRVSLDRGATWTTVATMPQFFAARSVRTADGSILTAGSGGTSLETSTWETRLISPDGKRIQALDPAFRLRPDGPAYARDLLVSSKGEIFVAGVAGDRAIGTPGGLFHWVVRKSSDGGRRWETVDLLEGADFPESSVPNRLFEDAHGDVYATGWWSPEGKFPALWTTRRASGPKSKPWISEDLFHLDTSRDSAPRTAFRSDGGTTLWTAGFVDAAGKRRRCMIREKRDAKSAWKETIVFDHSDYRACDIYGGSARAGRLAVVGEYLKSGNPRVSSGFVRVSSDDGKTWEEVLVEPGPDGPGAFSYSSVEVVDADHILLLGWYRGRQTGPDWFVTLLSREGSTP